MRGYNWTSVGLESAVETIVSRMGGGVEPVMGLGDANNDGGRRINVMILI